MDLPIRLRHRILPRQSSNGRLERESPTLPPRSASASATEITPTNRLSSLRVDPTLDVDPIGQPPPWMLSIRTAVASPRGYPGCVKSRDRINEHEKKKKTWPNKSIHDSVGRQGAVQTSSAPPPSAAGGQEIAKLTNHDPQKIGIEREASAYPLTCNNHGKASNCPERRNNQQASLNDRTLQGRIKGMM